PNPVVSFVASDSTGCSPLCIGFTDKSSVTAPSVITSWSWSLGTYSSPSSSSTQNPTNICYTNTGSQPDTSSLTLTVTTNNGCSATWTHPNYIIVYPNP